jgi:beta-N-acetylhexosaminidase
VLVLSALPLSAQTLDEKIGQMLIIGFRGFAVADDSAIAGDLARRNLGGVILYDYDVALKSSDRNIDSKRQLKRLTRELRRKASTPPFIAIDQEGGTVQRLKQRRGFKEALSHAHLGRVDSAGLTRREADKIAKLLSKLGVNLNFAPVVDVNLNPDNSVIGRRGRSFSDDPRLVAKHARVFIEAHEKQRVITAVKHFPGHGSAFNDSHHGMADVTAAWRELETMTEGIIQLCNAVK